MDYFNNFEGIKNMGIPEKIKINENYYLSHKPTENDIEALLQNLNDIDIYNGTLRVPFPYTREDAEFFIRSCYEQEKECGRPMKGQVRTNDGLLAVSITLHN